MCRAEAGVLAANAQSNSGRYRFVGIDSAELSRAAGEAFLRSYPEPYPELLDGSGAIAGRFGIADLPTTEFLAPNGDILATYLGALTTSELNRIELRLYHFGADHNEATS